MVTKPKWLSDARVEVLSSRAGGHYVGAPALREEVRALALEVQSRRQRAKKMLEYVALLESEQDRQGEDEE